MFEKIFYSKFFWLIVYIVLAFIAWNFDIKGPMRLFGALASVGVLHALGSADAFEGDGENRYKWVSVHLVGLLLAVYTAGMKLW